VEDEADERPSVGLPFAGVGMTPAERAWLHRWRTPVRQLLGGVDDRLTGELGAWADWTHSWVGLGGVARFEWAGGPPVAAVVDLLLPHVDEDGEPRGVPGLRLRQIDETAATLYWLAAPETSLYITRLPASDPAHEPFHRQIRQIFDTAAARTAPPLA
jgi:hypothetical protein